jgi:hypothetical protein
MRMPRRNKLLLLALRSMIEVHGCKECQQVCKDLYKVGEQLLTVSSAGNCRERCNHQNRDSGIDRQGRPDGSGAFPSAVKLVNRTKSNEA